MNKIFWRGFFVAACCVSGAPVFAQQPSSNLDLQELLEKNQTEYWKYREKTIRLRKQMDEQYKLLEADLKSMYQSKNNIQEEYYLVKEANDKFKAKKSDLSEYIDNFSTRVLEVIAVESKKVQLQYPGDIQESIALLSKCELLMQRDPRESVLQLIDYKRGIIAQGELTQVFEKHLSLGDAPSELIKGLRVGYVFRGLVSSNQVFSTIRVFGISGPGYKEIPLVGDLKAKVSSAVLDGFVANPQEKKQILVPIDVAQVGDRILHVSGGEKSTQIFVISYLVQLTRNGGVLMVPLFLVAIVAFGIAFSKFVFFYRNQVGDVGSLMAKVMESIREKNWQHAYDICEQDHFVARMLREIFVSRQEITDKKLSADVSERIFIQAISKEISKMNAGLSTLAVLAAVAPLIGLLGTVAGMIQLFDVITMYGSNNPKILAGGISVALITTQTGLAIAVPIMLLHHILVRLKTRSAELLESVGGQVLTSL